MSTQLNYREAVNKVYSSLKGKKRRIADRLLSAPERMIEKSIAEFAAECQCDQTTIVRFAQLLGYSGYAELKLAAVKTEKREVRIFRLGAGGFYFHRGAKF